MLVCVIQLFLFFFGADYRETYFIFFYLIAATFVPPLIYGICTYEKNVSELNGRVLNGKYKKMTSFGFDLKPNSKAILASALKSTVNHNI